MKNMGGRNYSLWDENDRFFYDVLVFPDGHFQKFRVRSLVGIVPLYAAETLRLDDIEPLQEFRTNFLWFVNNRPNLTTSCCHYIERKKQYELTIVDEGQLRRLLERVLSPEEFLSPFEIRSLSKYHEQHPFTFGSSEVRYDPAESDNKIKGGNSNWRGPYLVSDDIPDHRISANFGGGLWRRFQSQHSGRCARKYESVRHGR